jgi:hypothetical protein
MIKHTEQEGDYMRQPTTLERIETACYDTIATSGDTYEVRDAMTALGMTHLAMEPGKLPLAMRELWASMHGRTGLENLGIVATVAGYVAGGYSDPRTQEYADALRQDRREQGNS